MIIPAWEAWSATDNSDPEPLSGMSIEELMDVPVVSTSKKQVRLAETTAAVYVITADDIRRFGFTSVPEALRLVPGVNVARTNSGSWAISVRGFNGWLANKLLIMIDGRSVYTPLFSGVFWENLDVVMADIERIEVVRGPGATIWGANAVNGVINIITKDASRTTGGLITASGGDAEEVNGVLRIGGDLGDDSWLRGFVKYRQNAPVISADTNEKMEDDHRIALAGFRADVLAGDDEELSLQGTFTRSDFDQMRTTWLGLEPPYSTQAKTDDNIMETQLTADWHKVLSESSDLSLQIFWDTQHIHYVGAKGTVNRFDIDFNHHYHSGKHEVVWGAGYRLVEGEVEGTFDFDFKKPDFQDFNLNAFIQDDVTLVANRLGLVVGTKLEYNTRTEFEIQPNLRLLWRPHRNHSIWGAVSRAVRTPSIAEHQLLATSEVIPPGGLGPDMPAARVIYLGNDNSSSEKLLAYEIGYRLQPSNRVAVDLAAYYNIYEDLLSIDPLAPVLAYDGTTPYILIAGTTAQGLDADSHGCEVALDLRPTSWCRLRGAYTLTEIDETAKPGAEDHVPVLSGGNTPRHQGHVWVSLDLSTRLGLDAAWRFADKLALDEVTGYNELDLRLSCHLRNDLEVGVLGRNLLHEDHQESVSEDVTTSRPTLIPRSFAVSLRKEF